MLYLWLKALHIIAMVCWFAGLFYLPRLFVYHAMSSDAASHERFCIMERKLYRGIMIPSMIATLGLGIWLLSLNSAYYFSQGWMHAKLAVVLLVLRDGVAHTLANYSDPLPQALVLTAIVIAFAMTAVAVVVAMREHADLHTDHVDGEEPDEQRQGGAR